MWLNLFYDFENAITPARINIFWFCRKFQVATTLFYKNTEPNVEELYFD